MTESITQQIEDLDAREEFTDDLMRYVEDAAKEITRLASETTHDNIEEDYFFKRVSDILTENVYIPVVMGEEKSIRVMADDLEE